MVQRCFCMSRCDIGMALLALVDRFLQMFDGFCCVRIGLNLLTGFRVRERRLGVGGYAISTSMLAIINGLICVLNRLRDMVQQPAKFEE
jgi:hypothetical protein